MYCSVVVALFWLCGLGAVYSYFFYPAILLLLPRRNATIDAPRSAWPTVSIIVTAHNEVGRINDKLRNTLALDYPPDALEIIVASDASSDGTDDAVRKFDGVRLVRADERKGKEYAQQLAVTAARGEILVFSDVATQIPESAIRQLVRRFDDPRVGAISSEDRFVSQSGEVVGEGAYVRYEMWLRRLESSVNSLVGLSGSFFAARRSVCDDWNIRVPSDFNTALNAIRLGYVAISAPDVIGIYKDIADSRKEYQRKVRTIIRGVAALAARAEVLNPFRFGLFAFQVFSHKLMRWLVPWFLIGLLVTSFALAPSHFLYRAALAAQLAFYGLAAIGALAPAVRRLPLVKLPFFFLQVNLAVLHATLAFALGKRVTVWTPSKR